MSDELDDLNLDDIDLDDELDEIEETEMETQDSGSEESTEIDLDDLDLDDEIEDIQGSATDEVVAEISAPPTKVKGGSKKKADAKPVVTEDEDIDIELDDDDIIPEVIEKPAPVQKKKAVVVVEPETVAEPVVKEEPVKPAKKKAAPKKKAEKAVDPADEAIKAEVDLSEPRTIRYDPEFDISPANLDIKTLQVRKTKRDARDIEDLKNRIKLQGQVEEIKILVRDDKNYLIAGEGRVLALRQLDRPAKALVYTGLTDEDVLKISTGTNEGRLEMSEWDRTVSIGEYFDKDNMVSKDDQSDPKSLVSVFGMNKSSIYNYLKMWKFYKDKEIFQKFYAKVRCPLYVLTGVSEVLESYQDKIESYSSVVDILTAIMKRNDLSRKSFTNILLKELTDFLLKVKMSKAIADNTIIDAPLDDPKLAKLESKARNEIKSKMKLSEAEQIEKRLENSTTSKEIKESAEKLLSDIDESLESAIIALNELGELDFQNLIHSEKINATVKKVSQINRLVTILV